MTNKATFDFGDFTGADTLRVLHEMRAQNIRTENTEKGTDLGFVREWFLDFLTKTLTDVGHLDEQGRADLRLSVEVNVDLAAEAADVVKQLWNARASDWAVVETPITYVVTLETFLQHFVQKGESRQTLLSLGSGPGLYETFLGMLFEQVKATKGFRIVCVDFAREMTRKHAEILKSVRYPVQGTQTLRGVKNVEPVTGDMAALTFANQSIDHVLCNNALQWVPEWKKALAEMARVLKPEGHLYLFIHRHSMTVTDEEGKAHLKLPVFSVEDVLDEIERLGFEVGHIRQIGSKGGGQFGMRLDRVFVHARYTPGVTLVPWRERQKSAAMSTLRVAR